MLLLTVLTRPHRRRTRPRLGRRAVPDPQVAPQGSAQPTVDARERASGGPEDRAAYSCACGCVFEAAVSTTVGCPHCGGTQAW